MSKENPNQNNQKNQNTPPQEKKVSIPNIEIPQVTGVPQRDAGETPPKTESVQTPPVKPIENPVSPPPARQTGVGEPIPPKVSPKTPPPLTSATPQKPETPRETPTKKSSIRTFESDVAEALKKGDESLSSIALKEQERRQKTGEARPEKESAVSKKSLGIFALILLFIALGAGAIYFSFSGEEEGVSKPESIFTNPIVFSEDESVINISTLNKNDLILALAEKRQNYSGTVGSMENVYLTTGSGTNERLATGSEVLTNLDTGVPDALIRNISDKFMYGVHSFDGNDSFFIFKIKNFEVVFARMLEWENVLFDDLKNIFYDSPSEEFVFETEGEVGLGQDIIFKDIIVKSRDARSLKDRNDKEVLIYAFPDRSTLIITTNKETLEEIFTRLTASRL